MVKDRLADLKAAQRHAEEEEMEARGETTVLLRERDSNVVGYMKEFFGQVEELRKKVDQMSQDLKEVRRVQNEILAAPTSAENKMQQKLDELMAGIKVKAKQIRSMLKVHERGVEQARKSSKSPAEVRIRVLQYDTYSRLFIQLMTEYNQTQLFYREKCIARIRRQLEITGKHLDEAEIEKMLDDGKVAVFAEGIVMDTKLERQTLAFIEARHQDIIKLEASMRDLHNMFTDMAVVIKRHSEVLNRIVDNVGGAIEYVEIGQKDLITGRVYQQESRKKQILIIGCILLLAVVMFFIIAAATGLFRQK